MFFSKNLVLFIKYIGLALLYLFLLGFSCQASYLTSIRPLNSLLSGILKDIEEAQPDVLLDGKISPHTFSLKSSHIKKIRQAKVVFWIGPRYETFLIKPLTSLKIHNIEIANLPGLQRWPMRQSGDWQSSCCHDAENDHHDHNPSTNHKIFDAHIWLDIKNAMVITEFFYEYFLTIYPNHEITLQRNLKRMRHALTALNHQVFKTLQPCQSRAFLVYHDGYQYFEKAYHLSGVGVVISNPELTPSVHYIKNLLNRARHLQVCCIFSEHQFKSNFVDELVRTLNLNSTVLDPFGDHKYQDERDYIKMMQNLAKNFVSCLKNKS